MEINEKNYREILIEYLEDRLAGEDTKKVERYMLAHTEAWEEYQFLKHTKLKPDNKIVFPKKALLMKEEETPVVSIVPAVEKEEARVIPIRKMSFYLAGAAAIAAMLALAILISRPGPKPAGGIASNANVNREASHRVNRTTEYAQLPQLAENYTAQSAGNTEVSAQKQDKQQHAEAAMYHNPSVRKLNEGQLAQTHPAEKIRKDKLVPAASDGTEMAEKTAFVQTIQTPVQLVTNSENSNIIHTYHYKAIPLRTVANAENDIDGEDGVNPLGSIFNFFRHNVKIQKETINGDKYYAVSLETDKVKISKSFRTDF